MAGKQTPSPTVSEELLEQREGTNDGTDSLEEAAKEEKATQKAEMAAGKKGVAPEKTNSLAGENASDHVAAVYPGSGHRPDQLTVRGNDKVFYGHFCTVVKHKDVDKENEGVYGVYVDTVAFEENGDPKQVLVRTRDADNRLISVPYDAIRPAEGRGNAPR